MNYDMLAWLAIQAELASPMVAQYPDSTNEQVTFPPSPYYRFLNLLAAELNSNLSVELGVSGGGGSLHLAMASMQAVGVDIAWDHEAHITWIIKNYPNFYFLQGDSVDLAPVIHNRFGAIDVLFIDTTHTYAQTLAEYEAYLSYLSEHAVVCLDDLHRPGMDLAWEEMPVTKARFDALHPSQSPTDGGFGVIWDVHK